MIPNNVCQSDETRKDKTNLGEELFDNICLLYRDIYKSSGPCMRSLSLNDDLIYQTQDDIRDFMHQSTGI